jgi:hypothetical protein
MELHCISERVIPLSQIEIQAMAAQVCVTFCLLPG